MMSSAIYSIVCSEIGERQKSFEYFLDLLSHFRAPFMLVSESPNNETISFVTGLGGFLQVFLNGFAGIRIHEDGLLIEPCMPEAVPRLEIRGLHYAGQRFDVFIEEEKVKIKSPKALSFRVYRRSGEKC